MTGPVCGPSALISTQPTDHQQLLSKAASHHRAACAAIGRDIDLYSERELQVLLFDELELAPTSDLMTDTGSLQQLQDHYTLPFLEHLLAYRETMGALGDLG
ncbi:hypothetical protein [Nocardia sp.]|uniref:hypothetical protein n=1 Tax=Nocardia sp. TaxID=1821 RepID=UPI0026106A95|nr:hypothetical protein [Nocardia sp.]